MPHDEWAPLPTAPNGTQVEDDTGPYHSLEFLAGREAGWAECALAYGDAIETGILASGGDARQAKWIRRWFDSKVGRQA